MHIFFLNQMVNGIFWLISNEDGGGKLKTWFCEHAPIFLFNTYTQSTLYYSASVNESAISLLKRNFEYFIWSDNFGWLFLLSLQFYNFVFKAL